MRPTATRRAWLAQALMAAGGPALAQAQAQAQAQAPTEAQARPARPPAPASPTGGARPAQAAGQPLAEAPADTTDPVALGHTLRFPRDHGAHLGTAIEWWYATGWLGASAQAPAYGVQITFFRSRTPTAGRPPAQVQGRFAPRHLLFAHAAVTDLRAGRHRHAQRMARWSGEPAWPEAHAALDDTRLALGAWRLARSVDGVYTSTIAAPEAGFHLALQLRPTQPLLLQGQAGYSRKGPGPEQASHYYTQPQLALATELQLDGRRTRLQGQAWLDHEWSHALLAPDAVGWDWIGINLDDGSALTAFVLRRADGSVLWAGGSHRPAGAAVRSFHADEVQFEPLRTWTSPDTGARYPVRWRIRSPAGQHELHALLDAQELDSRGSTGAVYWEGLAELRSPAGQRLGLGYLEMTGRAGALRLGGG